MATYTDTELSSIIAMAEALVSDIDAMQHFKNCNWFGTFSEYDEGPVGIEIKWPNLAISATNLRGALEIAKLASQARENIELKKLESKMIEGESR